MRPGASATENQALNPRGASATGKNGTSRHFVVGLRVLHVSTLGAHAHEEFVCVRASGQASEKEGKCKSRGRGYLEPPQSRCEAFTRKGRPVLRRCPGKARRLTPPARPPINRASNRNQQVEPRTAPYKLAPDIDVPVRPPLRTGMNAASGVRALLANGKLISASQQPSFGKVAS